MDSSSVRKYINKYVFLTLKNGFWYKCTINFVNESAVEIIDLKKRQISISPEQITMIEEIIE